MGTYTAVGIVAIFSAILVFFSDELKVYTKALVVRPYLFAVFSLLMLSAYIEMNIHFVLWLLITVWIDLLLVTQKLSDNFLGNFVGQLFAPSLIVIALSTAPVLIALWMDMRVKRRALNTGAAIRKRGYVVGLLLWVSTVLLFVLGLPGSDFSG